MKNVLGLLKGVFVYRKYVLLNIFTNSVYVFFSLFSFILIIPFISVLFGVITPPAQCPEFALNKDVIMDYVSWHLESYKQSHGIYACLFAIGGCYLVCVFLSALFRYLGMFFLAPIRNGITKDLRNALYNKITTLPISFFSTRKKGDLIARLTSDLEEIEWSVLSSLQMLVKDPLMVLFCLITLILASWELLLLALVIMPVAYFLINKVGKSLKRNSTKAQSKIGALLSLCEEAIGGLRLIKSYNAESVIADKFSKSNDEYTKTAIKVARRRELASPLTEFLAIFALVFVVILGGTMVLRGKLGPEILIGFTLIFARMIAPLQAVSTAFYNLQRAEPCAKRINEILDADEKIIQADNALVLQSFENEIRFEDVCFSYDDSETRVLKNINLKIRKGETIALVGESGGGKSTLMDLIPRFADCTCGKIMVDGIDIKQLDINSLRKTIGYVSQQAILFNDTIFNNIAFGLPDAKMEDVEAAAKAANAHNFIMKTENGYQTRLIDRGMSLSGGERQRICIARELLKNPEILLLDEATSALDTQSEFVVQQAIDELSKSKTCIIIAHRLSTVTKADRIILLESGEIKEEGTYQELIRLNQRFARLVEMQTL